MNNLAKLIFDKNSKNADNIAVVDKNGVRKTTWKTLYENSCRIAKYAEKKGLCGVIPIQIGRCTETIEVILGLFLSGLGVAVLSDTMPIDRKNYIADETGNNPFTISDFDAAMKEEFSEYSAKDFKDDEIAMLVYTSGSTGTPKGVMLNMQSIILATIRFKKYNTFNYEKSESSIQISSFDFVAICINLLAPLYLGLTLHIADDSIRGDIAKLTDYINKYNITDLSFAPPQLIADFKGAESLINVGTGSDKVSNISPLGYNLLNLYGMSETACIATYYPIKEAMKSTPIGKPFDDFNAYILDENGNTSDEGELCISGAIAMGYYKNEEATKKAFVPNPFAEKDGCKTLLHTGDRVKRLPDGNLVHLGRMDFMIKINGQRVEPGEIENVMLSMPEIDNVVVKGFTEDDGRSFLCAYYVSSGKLDDDLIKAEIGKKLPKYMIPSVFMKMDKLPLNANGKIDRKSLPKPDFSKLQADYEAPTNEKEKAICTAFEKALKLAKVGINDDFFKIGGDSINAMKVSAEIKDYNVTVSDVMSGRTPKNIAEAVEGVFDIYSNLPKKQERAKLTDSQNGIYLECMLSPENVMYNIPLHIWTDKGDLTAETVKNAVDDVISAHPMLYATLSQEDEDIYFIRRDFPSGGMCEIETVDAFDKTGLVKPFSLLGEPLCRAKAFITADEIHIFIDMHHIVSDGTSAALIKNQITEALCGAKPKNEDIDAFSLICAEDKIKASDEYANAKKYFESIIGGIEIDSNLLADKTQKSDGTIPSETLNITIDNLSVSDYLNGTGITESTFFMSVYGYTLAKMTGQSESFFGVAENGRNSELLNNTVSMMVKTLPLYMKIDETKTAMSLMRDVQNQFFNSVKYDAYSFVEMAKEFGINSDVMFVYQSDMLTGDENVKMETLDTGAAFSNLGCSVYKNNTVYVVSLQYRSDWYNNATIERFGKLFVTVASSFMDDKPLCNITLISDNDKNFLDEINHKTVPYDKTKTIVDIFKDVAKANKNKPAVVYLDKSYTFGEVDEITDRIAEHITSLGIGKGKVVSVLIPRCEYMVIASLGVMKAGAIYQPLDPTYPSERLDFMCKDADAQLLIADKNLLDKLTEYNGNILLTDEISNLPKRDVELCAPSVDDTFILLYTSGTTGTPKGCMLKHSNLAAFICTFSNTLGLDETDRVTAYASYGFDAHIGEIYPALANSDTVYIIAEEIRLNFPEIKKYVEENGITILFMTTQVARQFITEYSEVKGLRYVMTGGEKLVSYEPNNSYKVLNAYGPTECTVFCTSYCVESFCDNIPIGKNVPNARLYIVDTYGRRVPVGVPGELICSGPQVGGGYLNRPEKTAEVFVENTFEDDNIGDYGRCYKTGDIVRFIDDGNIEYIGRRDLQVKIRGFRIELSEVEKVIREYPDIKDVTVIARDEKSGGKCVHAYVVSDKQINFKAVSDFIRESKPPYMVPAAFMQIDEIPLNVNYKVDKRKLPIIESVSQNETDQNRSMTAVESEIFDIVKEIVGHDSFSVETEFADVGITSVTSIKLSVKIYKKFGVNVTSKDLLNGGSILSVENYIVSELIKASQTKPEATAEKLASYPLTQTQIGIYTDCLIGSTDAYNIPYMIKLPKNIDKDRYFNSVRQAVKAHPSILVYIYADENGDVEMHPQLDMEIEISEETAGTIPPAPTHFEFEKSPLFKFRFVTYNGDNYMYFEIHHIICDGESLTILLNDIDTIYSGGSVEPESYTIFDLSVDEHTQRDGVSFERGKAFYDSVFRGVSADYLPVAELNNEPMQSELKYKMDISPSDVSNFCTSNNITENVFFTGVFAMLISKFTFHEDALFATIYNGRTDPRTESLISMLVKTIPVFTELQPELGVGEYLKGLSKTINQLKTNDIYSFSDAAHDYGVNANMIFVYQGRMMSEVKLNGKVLESVEVAPETAKAEISFEVFLNDDGYSLISEYNGGKYSEKWMEIFVDAFNKCAYDMMNAKTLAEVTITSEKALAEYNSINDTDWEIPFRPAYRILKDSADRHPDRLAVISCGEKLTYSELDNMSNCLGHKLLDSGIKPESGVMVITDRTKEIYVAQHGILKAGCAFLCMSPEYPNERITFVAEDSKVCGVVTTHSIADRRPDLFEELGLPIFFADDIDKSVKSDCPNIELTPESPAYMIYTSGSTGKPKGVKLIQRGLINYVNANPKNPSVTAYVTGSEVASAVTAFTFDASICEEYIALANGMTLCIATEDDIHNPVLFTKLCRENHITSMTATPSFFLSLLDCDDFCDYAKNLVSIKAGGEVFSKTLLDKFLAVCPNLVPINGYGPTEATVETSCKVLKAGEKITIGSPTVNTKYYIIDKQNHILPMGALGELAILGDCVGAGYINRDDLTQKVFIKINDIPTYKSGDLALITHSEDVEFHGRIDNQVKLRGLRVELGEIESAINNCPGVNSCIVTVHGDEKSRFLAAYYTAERQISSDEITEIISKTLTEYMVPRVFIQLDTMPMTANGKIDKKALPEPNVETERNEYIPPSNDDEKSLCEAFQSALGIDNIGVTDDFFTLGGTSLTATKVAMYAMSHNMPIVYADIFKYPTVRELAKLINKSGEADDTNSDATNFDKANDTLSQNVYSPDKNDVRELGNMLLTGATGFLGIHVLKHFLENETGNVVCLVRKGSGGKTSSETRLKTTYFYYFGESLEKYMSRIQCVDGDITDENEVMTFEKLSFDTLFNCAACVKHFAKGDEIEKINVHGVENLIKLCKKTNKRLIHVSTISVAGEGQGGTPMPDKKMYETELFFDQILENQYISSKFKAEKIILDEVSNGLDAKIMRAGNLMPRRVDGEFQINFLTNGFMRQLRGYAAVGCVSYSALTTELEFSPIDETAAAMLTLAKSNSAYTVFHPTNTHRVYLSDVIKAMNDVGLKIEAVDEAEFVNRMNKALSDAVTNQAVSGLIVYMNHDTENPRYMIGYDNSFTGYILYRMGFGWQTTDIDYIRSSIKKIMDYGFFDVEDAL